MTHPSDAILHPWLECILQRLRPYPSLRQPENNLVIMNLHGWYPLKMKCHPGVPFTNDCSIVIGILWKFHFCFHGNSNELISDHKGLRGVISMPDFRKIFQFLSHNICEMSDGNFVLPWPQLYESDRYKFCTWYDNCVAVACAKLHLLRSDNQ